MKKKRQNGFSLLEVLVAVGLLSGLALAGMALFKNQSKAQKTVEANYEVTTIVSQMRGVLASIVNCSASFQGLDPDNGTTTRLRKDVNSVLENVYQAGAQLPGNISVISYQLDSTGQIGNETILKISFSRGRAAIKDEITKSLKVVYTTDAGGNINSCYAFNNNSDTYWVQSIVDPNDIHYPGGDIGIGDSNPQVKLSVLGSAKVGAGTGFINSPGYLSISSTSTHTAVQFMNNASALWRLGTDTSNNGTRDFYIFDNASAATRFRIDTAGRAYIGNSSATTLLNVAGQVASGSVGTNGGYHVIDNSGVSTGLLSGSDGSPGFVSLVSSTANNYLSLNTNGGAGVAERLRITGPGDIGISTSTPAHKLHVNGTVASRSGTASDGFITMQPGSASTQGYLEWWKPGPARVAYMGYSSANTNNLLLQLEAGANYTIMGNVGIGTGTPGTTLEVNGHMAAASPGLAGFVQLWSDNSVMWKAGNGNGGLRFGSASNLAAAGYSQKMIITDSGNVGIGTGTPSYPLHVNGFVGASAFMYESDRSLKKDISRIDNPLSKILRLRGVNFTWKKNDIKDLGFIAQEVEKVEPRLVVASRENIKSVKYGNIIAIVVEAIKELFGISEDLKKENEILRSRIENLEERLQRLESNTTSSSSTKRDE